MLRSGHRGELTPYSPSVPFRSVLFAEHQIIDSVGSLSDPMEHVSSMGLVSPCIGLGLVSSCLVSLAVGCFVSNIHLGDYQSGFEYFERIMYSEKNTVIYERG